MSFYDDASLVVIPSGFKTSKVYAEKPTDGSGDLIFTRTGDTATRVNSAGLIEEVRTNLFVRSETFTSASWLVGGGGASVFTDNFATAPNGTQTAAKWTAANTNSQVRQNVATINTTATVSVYMRTNSGTKSVTLFINDSGATSVVTVTTSWQRFTLTGVVGATLIGSGRCGFSNVTILTSGDYVEIWGAQYEISDFGATAYIPTTSAAVSTGPVANVPRLDYLGSTCPRLILEPQRQNLVTNSERFTSWLSAGGTLTSNTAISPDGYQNADTLTGARYQSGFGSNQYTVSCFAKKVDGDGMFVLRLDAPTLFSAQFNLNTGAIVSTSAGYTSTITNYGNGWYRCTLTTPVSTTIANFVLVSATGSTASTYIWGAQCEAGTYATSYIPTLAASATRGADACSKTGISSLIGQTEGVLFVDFTINGLVNFGTPISVNNGTSLQSIWLTIFANGNLRAELYNGATQASITYSGAVVGGRYKMAFGYKTNDFVLYVNGAQVGTDNSGTTFSGTTLSRVDTDLANASLYSTASESINQALLFTTRLTNAELATLTTL